MISYGKKERIWGRLGMPCGKFHRLRGVICCSQTFSDIQTDIQLQFLPQFYALRDSNASPTLVHYAHLVVNRAS